MTDKNLSLWNQVSQTDPQITNRVNARGGFTAICAQSQLKAATEVFGIYGVDWGMNLDSDEYIRDGSGNVLEYVWKGSLWFNYAGKKGVLCCQSSIKYRAGDDCQVKAETHARSKALSKLGFNSDVYEGKFDDNKYVAERAKQSRTPDDRTLAIRNLTAACRAAKVTDEQKVEYKTAWCKRYSVDSFDALSVKQINECITEIKQLDRGVTK